MTALREYIVTGNSWEHLDSLCADIEAEGGDLYIPNRRVEVALERPMSRNTHYYLTAEEAELLRNDARVSSVELKPEERGITPIPFWTQQSESWDKSAVNETHHRNWGLLRCTAGQNPWAWGETNKTGTVSVTAEGRHVDVVIVDGLLDSNHPEFAVNPDGTGGSRVIQYDWFQHSLQVEGVARSGSYTYGPYVVPGNENATRSNNHGCHVGGTVAGITQGWARSANIYNISPFGDNGVGGYLVFDYIRAFHLSKPVNPITKRRNPTIVNNSWGYQTTMPLSNIANITYRGTAYTGPFTASSALSYKVRTYNDGNMVQAQLVIPVPSVDADSQDLIDSGAIMIGAAGNFSKYIDKPGGADFDNTLQDSSGYTWEYNRGGSPSSAPRFVCVGAIGTAIDEKASYSNNGPRIDIYAPGSEIASSVHSGGISDPRNASYQLKKYDGTSMASPQVCGVLACALEAYPNMTQEQAHQYLRAYGKTGQIYVTAQDYFDIQGSDNRYLYYYKERQDTGNTWPKTNNWLRTSNKLAFPRTKIRRTS